MTPELTELLLLLLSFTFGAGAASFVIKQTRKDVTGLGKFVHRKAVEHEKKFKQIELALMLMSKNDPEGRRIVSILEKEESDVSILEKEESE